MADFDIPGLRPVDGLNPSPVNFPEAGKRPFSSMSPAILTDCSGDVQLVLGASGGKRITTAVSLVRGFLVACSPQKTGLNGHGALHGRLGRTVGNDWVGLGREYNGALREYLRESFSFSQ